MRHRRDEIRLHTRGLRLPPNHASDEIRPQQEKRNHHRDSNGEKSLPVGQPGRIPVPRSGHVNRPRDLRFRSRPHRSTLMSIPVSGHNTALGIGESGGLDGAPVATGDVPGGLAALQAADTQAAEARRADQETLRTLKEAKAKSDQKIAELEKRLQS